MAGSQKDTTGGLLDADDVRGSGCAENAILSNDELLDAVCGTDLCDQLRDLGVVVTTVTADDKEGAIYTLGDGEKNAGDKGL